MTDAAAAGTAPPVPVPLVAVTPLLEPAASGAASLAPRTPQSASQSTSTTAPQLRDLDTRDDLERLLRDFYDRALADPLLRPVFVDVMHMDLEAHLPQITDFWQKVLFGTGTYDGQAMAAHRRIHQLVPLTRAHFDRWLELWRDAVSERHAGSVAGQAVAHADRMAAVFLRNLLEPRRPGQSLPIVAGVGGTA